MKLLEDYRDIENVGEILVKSFVQEGQLTEGQANLLVSKSMLFENPNVKSTTTTYVVKGHVITLDNFITVYVEYDRSPDVTQMMMALGVSVTNWDSDNPNNNTNAIRKAINTMIDHFRKTAEGRKWIFPKLIDRRRYSEAAAKSIHPNRLSPDDVQGVDAIPVEVGHGDGDDNDATWDEREMVDRGRSGKRNKSTQVINSFNKSEIATGEFYNDITRLKQTRWGSIWKREIASVRSDTGGLLSRKWKKIFVLGYQIDKSLLYEIWYGTIDGQFTLHDSRGNQISRKFPTVSEATKALTNAIVQSGNQDAEIFKHGGADKNRIAASIVKTLNMHTDDMVNDLMAIEDKDLQKRAVLQRKRDMERRNAERNWNRRVAAVQQAATSPIQTSKAVGSVIQQGAEKIFDLGTLVTISSIAGISAGAGRSKELYAYAKELAIQNGGQVTLDAAKRIADKFVKSPAKRIALLSKLKAGMITFDEYMAEITLLITDDSPNANPSLRMPTGWSQRYTKEEEAAMYEPSYTRRSPSPNMQSYSNTPNSPTMTVSQLKADILASGVPPYAERNKGNKEAIKNYIAMLIDTGTYSGANRSKREELELIAVDVYGAKGNIGNIRPVIVSMKSRLKRNLLESYSRREYDNQDDQELVPFDIDDQLDARRDSTIQVLRRNSAKVAMSIGDMKQMINDDMVQMYSKTRIDESKWRGTFTRILNSGRKYPISLPTDKPSIKQRVMGFFQGTRYRADFVTGVSLSDRINVEVWYITEPNPALGILDMNGVVPDDVKERNTISSFYVFDVTSGTLVRKYLPYHKNAIQVAIAKLGAL